MQRCKKHPKYKGKKQPTYECVDCLNLYLKLSNKPRAPILPSKVEKDKTKYDRKNKGWKNDQE